MITHASVIDKNDNQYVAEVLSISINKNHARVTIQSDLDTGIVKSINLIQDDGNIYPLEVSTKFGSLAANIPYIFGFFIEEMLES